MITFLSSFFVFVMSHLTSSLENEGLSFETSSLDKINSNNIMNNDLIVNTNIKSLSISDVNSCNIPYIIPINNTLNITNNNLTITLDKNISNNTMYNKLALDSKIKSCCNSNKNLNDISSSAPFNN